MFSHFNTEDSLMIIDLSNGENHAIPVNEAFRYEKAVNALNNNNYEELKKILYPDKHFSLPGFEMIDNSLYLNGEKLPNIVSLSLIHNEDFFYGLYNFWMNSSKRNWDSLKEELVTALNNGGYPISDDGFFIATKHYSKDDIGVFFSYAQSHERYRDIFDKKLKIPEIIDSLSCKNSKKLTKVFNNVIFNKESKDIKTSYFTMIEFFSHNIKHENLIKLLEKTPYNQIQCLRNINSRRIDLCIDFLNTYYKNKDQKIINLFESSSKDWNPYNSFIQAVTILNDLKLKIDIDINTLNFKSFKELYELLLREEHKLKHKPKRIDMPSNFPALIKNKKALQIDEEHSLIYPESNYDLAEWSSKMSNCIRGYTDRANDPNFIIMAVMKGEQMLINLEFRKIESDNEWRIIQFKKYGNRGEEGSKLAKKVFNHVKKEIIEWREPPFSKSSNYPLMDYKKYKNIIKNFKSIKKLLI